MRSVFLVVGVALAACSDTGGDLFAGGAGGMGAAGQTGSQTVGGSTQVSASESVSGSTADASSSTGGPACPVQEKDCDSQPWMQPQCSPQNIGAACSRCAAQPTIPDGLCTPDQMGGVACCKKQF